MPSIAVASGSGFYGRGAVVDSQVQGDGTVTVVGVGGGVCWRVGRGCIGSAVPGV